MWLIKHGSAKKKKTQKQTNKQKKPVLSQGDVEEDSQIELRWSFLIVGERKVLLSWR